MKRKNKIIMSAMVATLLFVIAITYATIQQPEKEVSGKIETEDIIIDDSDISDELQQTERKVAEEQTLPDLKEYFDTAIYLPTVFPYHMQCLDVKMTDANGYRTANVNYHSEEEQKYLLFQIQPANKNNVQITIEEYEAEQNEVRIQDSTELLYSSVSEGFLQAYFTKEGMFYQFKGNLTTEELITIVESMIAKKTSIAITKEEFLTHMEEIGIRVKEMDSRELSYGISLDKSSTEFDIVLNVQSIGGYASEVGMKNVSVRAYESGTSSSYVSQRVEGFYNTDSFSSIGGYTITNPIKGKAYLLAGTLYTIINGVEYTYYIESDKYIF